MQRARGEVCVFMVFFGLSVRNSHRADGPCRRIRAGKQRCAFIAEQCHLPRGEVVVGNCGSNVPAHSGGGKLRTFIIGASEETVSASRFAGELNAAGCGHVEVGAVSDDDPRAAGAETLIDCPEGRGGIGRIDEERAGVEIEEGQEPGGGERAAADPEDWGGGGIGRGRAGDVPHDGERRQEVVGGRGREELDERGRGGCSERGERGGGERSGTATTERRAGDESAMCGSRERGRLAGNGEGDGRRC